MTTSLIGNESEERRATRQAPLLVGFAAALTSIALSAAACGGGGGDDSTPVKTTVQREAGAINASLGEFFIRLDKTSVPAGKVKFTIANKGSIKHEFVVIKSNLAPDKLPVRGKEAKESVGPSPGEVPDLPAGKTGHLTVDLKPGKYVLICNLPGHYKAGQRTGLTVR